ncbi:hypothetical protein [Taklimakanibacter deserti]|uniref:hypothetical protein n=1 Tax=Taklimakanibacter deserti TaxID=2267839 RepID=UPI000E65D8DD
MAKLRKTKRTLLALAIFLAVPALYIGVGCRGSSDIGSSVTVPVIDPETRTKVDGVPNYRFPEEKSYLTFPEWYIVYTSQDFASYIDKNYPNGFSYFRSAGEFWTSYCAVNQWVTPRYEFNFGTHLMIYVIGISHTVEYVIKGIYENTIGRLSELFAPVPPTPEDLFQRKYAFDYGQWLNTVPWYDFAFGERLTQFWETVPFAGPGPVRKAERRFAVSAELAVKAAYGWLIKGGSETVYEPAQLEIHALMRGLPLDTAPIDRRIVLVETFRDGTQLVKLPRYQPFTEIVQKLGQTNATFLEIGGNSNILISLTVPDNWAPPEGMPPILFETKILSGAGGKRVGLSVPVTLLLDVVRNIAPSGAQLEHVYDY